MDEAGANEAGGRVGGAGVEEVREQDRYLPIANISRIMKKSLVSVVTHPNSALLLDVPTSVADRPCFVPQVSCSHPLLPCSLSSLMCSLSRH